MNAQFTSLLFYIGLFTFSLYSQADVKHASEFSEITQLYHSLASQSPLTMSQRLALVSSRWLHKPYALFALGEGSGDQYDENPRYRTDAFDCETFVDTVLAITLTTNPSSFKRCIDKIRYHNGQVGFTTRNHFTSVDWNKNNQANGLLRDITRSIKNQAGHAVALMSETDINKANWYANLPASRIRLTHATLKQQIAQLKKLHQAGRSFPREHSSLPYLSFNTLFDSQGRENSFVFKQIPDGAIIEIVRPNWDLIEKIGTRYDISHLGLVFWSQGVLVFRQASSERMQVVDVPLLNYLREQRKNPTIQGINIQVLVPKTPRC